jgi:hypothetical protein
VGKTSATKEDTSNATPIIKTTITEVVAEAEAEEVETEVTETTVRELTARMINQKLFPVSLFLLSTSRILRNSRPLKRENSSLVI